MKLKIVPIPEYYLTEILSRVWDNDVTPFTLYLPIFGAAGDFGARANLDESGLQYCTGMHAKHEACRYHDFILEGTMTSVASLAEDRFFLGGEAIWRRDTPYRGWVYAHANWSGAEWISPKAKALQAQVLKAAYVEDPYLTAAEMPAWAARICFAIKEVKILKTGAEMQAADFLPFVNEIEAPAGCPRFYIVPNNLFQTREKAAENMTPSGATVALKVEAHPWNP